MYHAADMIRRAVREVDDDMGDVRVYERYSGRGMFGKMCIGVVGTLPTCMTVLKEVIKTASVRMAENIAQDPASEDEEVTAHALLCDQMFNYNYDSLGLDTIVYWPKIPSE